MDLPAGARAALLSTAWLAACGTSQLPPAGDAAPAAYSAQVLELRDAALNARDLDGAVRAYHPDAVIVDADTGTVVLRGRDEIRAAHAQFLARCPNGRVEVLDRSYQERGRIVTDVERVTCGRAPPMQGWVRYEIAGGAVVRVLKHRSPLF